MEFGYPLTESLRSLLPLVDELVVNVGDAEDGTWEAVMAIGDPKVVAFRSTWDLTKRDGLTLSEETNKALARCRGDWAVYLQADEVLHERDLPALRDAMTRDLDTGVEAFSLRYFHFYGSYQTCQDDPRHWYPRATRIVRLGRGVESVGDACAFMQRDGSVLRHPRRRRLGAHVYHYGRVRPPAVMLEKQRAFERLYYDEGWLAEHGLREDTDPGVLVAHTRHLRRFTGTHPAVMAPTIAAAAEPAVTPPRTLWPEWARRGYVYSAWALERMVARMRRAASSV